MWAGSLRPNRAGRGLGGLEVDQGEADGRHTSSRTLSARTVVDGVDEHARCRVPRSIHAGRLVIRPADPASSLDAPVDDGWRPRRGGGAAPVDSFPAEQRDHVQRWEWERRAACRSEKRR